MDAKFWFFVQTHDCSSVTASGQFEYVWLMMFSERAEAAHGAWIDNSSVHCLLGLTATLRSAESRDAYQHGEDGQVRHVYDTLCRGHSETERERHEAADAKPSHDDINKLWTVARTVLDV